MLLKAPSHLDFFIPGIFMDLPALRTCLEEWLASRCSEKSVSWLRDRRAALQSTSDAKKRQRLLFTGFSGCSRYFSHKALELTGPEIHRARALRPLWDPSRWTQSQCARTLIVLSWPENAEDGNVALLDKLFEAGDVEETVALYQALPLFPQQDKHRARCAEGIRTNITSAFKAVAHYNPYPKEHLDENAWNQLVLKSLFVGVALHPIVGLEERANPTLTQMLCDYAQERWSAGRWVSPELWRCVALNADDEAMKDLRRALEGKDELSARGSALAITKCPHDAAKDLRTRYPVAAGAETWESLATASLKRD